jgi:hypothetical protein
MQFGYFVGSIAGGVALAVGGYGAFGGTMAALFLGAAAILAGRPTFARLVVTAGVVAVVVAVPVAGGW